MNEAILDKLRKVLNLAHGRNATRGEVESALARAKDIALRHGIDLASISLDPDNGKSKGPAIQARADKTYKPASVYVREHHKWILGIVDALFGVQSLISVYREGSRKRYDYVCLIGESSDLLMAREVLSWLDTLIPQLARNLGYDYYRNATAFRGFCQGFYAGVLENNRKQEAALTPNDASQWALVLRTKKDAIEELKKQLFPVIEAPKQRRVKVNPLAVRQGYEEGSRLKLSQLKTPAQGKELR